MSVDDHPQAPPDSAPLPTSEGGTEVYRPSGRRPLDALFAPRGVAVVGTSAEPGSPGRLVLANLMAHPGGAAIAAIHPDRPSLPGLACCGSLGEVTGPVDLAVLVEPGMALPERIDECAAAGVGAAIVLGSWPGGTDEERADWQARVRLASRRGRVRLLGPASGGVVRPAIGLNASVAEGMVRAGRVAFFSQGGALAAAVGEWSLRAGGVGFSAFGSLGAALDIDWADLIDHLGDDPETRSIVLAPEAIGDARAVVAAAREVAGIKPIIVVTPGRAEAHARITAIAPGGADVADEVLAAAFRRGGVVRAASLADVFHLADALARPARPRGSRLAIVTNAPGPAALADAALLGPGGVPAVPGADAARTVPADSRRAAADPIDLGAGADAARFAEVAGAVAADPGVDGVLVVVAAGATTDLAAVAQGLVAVARSTPKPVLASILGGPEVDAAAATLRAGGVATTPAPDTAARVFAALARHGADLAALVATPTLDPGAIVELIPRAEADVVIARALGAGRLRLDEVESKAVLRGHGLPVIATRVAATEAAAVAAAEAIGYPVALKLYSRTVAAHAELGGVHLDLRTAAAVRAAFWGIEATVGVIEGPGHMLGVAVEPSLPPGGIDLVVRSRLDPGLGPFLELGTGGPHPGSEPDRAVELPPLTPDLARRLVERARVAGSPRDGSARLGADSAALDHFLVGFARLVIERPRLAAIEVDLVASPAGVVVLDARIALHAAAVADADLPRPAIRPYPGAAASSFTATDGGPVAIRPIRAEDEPLVVGFHEAIVERRDGLDEAEEGRSPALSRAARDRITRLCRPDYDRTMALVVDHREPWTDRHEVLGVGRLRAIPGTDEAELALLVAPEHRCRGFATELLRRLLAWGRDAGFARVVATLRADDHAARRVAAKFGFRADRTGTAPTARLSLELATYVEPVAYPPAPDGDGRAGPQAGPLAEPTSEMT